MPTDRRTWWLAGGGLLAVVFAFWMVGGQGQAPVAASGGAARPRGPAAAAPRAEIDDVRLEALGAGRTEPAGQGRNPFRFQAGTPPPAERPTMTAAPSPAPEPPVAPAGPPPPLPIPFKFIGIVERPGGLKLAVLTDGRSVVHGREGDIIEGQYRILRIGVESIEMAYADGRGRQTIRLSGQ